MSHQDPPRSVLYLDPYNTSQFDTVLLIRAPIQRSLRSSVCIIRQERVKPDSGFPFRSKVKGTAGTLERGNEHRAKDCPEADFNNTLSNAYVQYSTVQYSTATRRIEIIYGGPSFRIQSKFLTLILLVFASHFMPSCSVGI